MLTTPPSLGVHMVRRTCRLAARLGAVLSSGARASRLQVWGLRPPTGGRHTSEHQIMKATSYKRYNTAGRWCQQGVRETPIWACFEVFGNPSVQRRWDTYQMQREAL